jgi:Flp pilus assembly protein TadD
MRVFKASRMAMGLARVLIVAAAGVSLAGCTTTSSSFSDVLGLNKPATAAAPDGAMPPADASAVQTAADDTTGTVPPFGGPPKSGLLGGQPYDDLSIGKRYFKAGNYGLAERYFRRAVETHARDAEAWLGLAASYDRLRRFDLADRAYTEAIRLVGPRVAILNNQGYSYMLRGDYKRARAKLEEAAHKDPGNRFVENNLRLLAEAASRGKAVE